MTRAVSYIIPFKDWGLTRLELAVETALSSLEGAPGEVIVSDYGSTFGLAELERFRSDLEERGARYIRTETDGVWSRSRALNAGAEQATGDIFVASDADMLIPPGCLRRISEELTNDPHLAIFLSCLDLPERWDDEAVRKKGIDWDVLRGAARRRPRWGMGLNAVTRELFDTVRGWDERFLMYGGEDNDFSVRLRRAGARVVWPEGDEFALLHMWHPSSSEAARRSPAVAAQVERNKAIFRTDRTFNRNVMGWRYRTASAPPLVSVVISTFNRRQMLAEAIDSVLIQTMQDFEIVIVDDGSTDDTADFVRSLQDPRIHYVYQDNTGISAARNRGTRESRGQYIAVLDDDDLMLPWRLESQLAVQEDAPAIAFGTFVNFQDETGEMVHMGVKPMDLMTVALKGGAPGHSTWLVPREWMLRVPYDESLSSGVDNDLALRFLRSGMRWVFCGDIVVLRRMHCTQVTVSDSSNQLGSASAALNRVQFGSSSSSLARTQQEAASVPNHVVQGLDGFEDLVSPYLPDHLVDRWRLELVDAASAAWDDVVVESSDRRSAIDARPVSWGDLVSMGPDASLGSPLVAEPKGSSLGHPQMEGIDALYRGEVERLVRALLGEEGPGTVAVISESTEGEQHRYLVHRRGKNSLAVDSFPVHGRDLEWMPDWLTVPRTEVAVHVDDIEELRDKWQQAVSPRRFQWRR